MSELKDFWTQTAKSFVLALNDLSISIVESVRVGKDKAVEWARKDNPHYEAQAKEVAAEEAAADDEPAAQESDDAPSNE